MAENRYKKLKQVLRGLALGLALLGGAGLVYNVARVEASEEAQAQGGAPPAMAVQVDVIEREPVQIWKNFSGRIVAVDYAEIRPQVAGRITELRFEDGQRVEKGDVLIVIDPSPYQASLNQARAALEAAQTQAALAEKEYQRAVKLIASDAIAQSLLDERANNREAAAAAVQGAKALVESAKINLNYAYVKAPISGKISRAEITVGNVVQPGAGAPLLTSIVADESVYVDFEVDERTYLGLVAADALSDVSQIPVRLKLQDANLEYDGVVHSFDNRIDPTSGTIRARAIFENEDGALLPGMTVSVLMGGASDDEQILVSERAIGTDQDRKFVYTVDEENAAKYREVRIGESVQGKRVILSGLSVGDLVIAEGLVRIRPGMKVDPQIASAEAAPEVPEVPVNADVDMDADMEAFDDVPNLLDEETAVEVGGDE